MLDFVRYLLQSITPQEYELRRVKKKINKEVEKEIYLCVRVKIKYLDTINALTLQNYQVEFDYKQPLFHSSKERYIISFY